MVLKAKSLQTKHGLGGLLLRLQRRVCSLLLSAHSGFLVNLVIAGLVHTSLPSLPVASRGILPARESLSPRYLGTTVPWG